MERNSILGSSGFVCDEVMSDEVMSDELYDELYNEWRDEVLDEVGQPCCYHLQNDIYGNIILLDQDKDVIAVVDSLREAITFAWSDLEVKVRCHLQGLNRIIRYSLDQQFDALMNLEKEDIENYLHLAWDECLLAIQ